MNKWKKKMENIKEEKNGTNNELKNLKKWQQIVNKKKERKKKEKMSEKRMEKKERSEKIKGKGNSMETKIDE